MYLKNKYLAKINEYEWLYWFCAMKIIVKLIRTYVGNHFYSHTDFKLLFILRYFCHAFLMRYI